MVIEDLSYQSNKPQTEYQPAGTLARFLAGVFDFLLFSPMITFVPALHIKDARLDYAQGFDSAIWVQIFVIGLLTHILLQTGFVYFFRATPGQAIMGIKVKTLTAGMSWNQALIRSTFFSLSWLFMGLPLLEMLTHPLRRCWHDRVSDTMVVTAQKAGRTVAAGRPVFSVSTIRASMIVGFFFLFLMASSYVTRLDSMTFTGDISAYDQVDTIVAKALLKKDMTEETRAEIDEKLWNAKTTQEKAVAYFYRFQNEKENEVRKALSHQICEWRAHSLCLVTDYVLDPTAKKLSELVSQMDQNVFLSARVAVMKELTKQSRVNLALNLYKGLKSQSELQDELRIWDVSLFLKIRNATTQERVPASADLKEALAKFESERGEP